MTALSHTEIEELAEALEGRNEVFRGRVLTAVSSGLDPKLLTDIRAALTRAGRCAGCRGTTTFDHGSGEGTIEKCIPIDPASPPHRFCPCIECKGTGLDEGTRSLLARLP